MSSDTGGVTAQRILRCVLLGCMLFLCFHPGLYGVFAIAQNEPVQPLSVSINPTNCVYSLGSSGVTAPVLRASVAAEVDHLWLHSSDYPKCSVSQSDVTADLGPAHQWIVEYSGLAGKPNLEYVLRRYDGKPFVDVLTTVTNQTGQTVEVQNIRSIEASQAIDLGGALSQDRVLSDSFSEDRPAMRIHDLGDARNNMQRGVGSQLIYNRQTHRSLFVGALSSDRFLTILRLHVAGSPADPSIPSYDVDSTGTTEMEIENSLRQSPAEDRIELSLPVAPGDCLRAERVLVSV
jgi:alpha-galactosidase